MRHRLLGIVISGAGGIAAQIILLRELLVSFQGNELSLGIILANWLLLEAVGCLAAGKISRRLRHLRAVFALTQVAVAGSLALGIFVARAARPIMGLPPGAGLGIDAMLVVSTLALLPVALLHGASFAWSTLVLGDRETSLGTAYVYETLGTMVGGALVTVALIPLLHAYDLAFVVMLLSLTSVGALWWDITQTGSRRCKAIAGTCVGLAIVALYPVALGYRELHTASLQRQWAGQTLVSHKNSIYGNIAVVRRAGEYTFFVDGQPVITTPFPDVARIEELVHFTMLSHPNPQTVAVLTGGAGGKINEILKHPAVVSVDYVELDPMLLRQISAFPTALSEFELTHPKVRLHFTDGRHFIEHTTDFFDVCFIGITNPTDLQTNRFFTREFFAAAKERLRSGGILALALPSLPRAELVIYGLADVNRIVYGTLRDVFPHVRVYPGESVNLFLASTGEYIMYLDASSMAAKIQENGLDLALVSEPHLGYRTLPWWQENFYASIGSVPEARLNLDFTPRVVFASIMFFSEMFTPSVARVLDFIKAHGTLLLLLSLGCVLVVGLYFRHNGDIPVSIFTTGFAGMLLDLVMIFAFQAIFGYVFHWIGILVSVFMAGAATAAFGMTRRLPNLMRPAKTFVLTEVAITIFAVALPGILVVLNSYAHDFIPTLISKAIFVLLSFVCGLLVGAQYPLACRLRLEQGEKPGSTTGLLYGLDLLGGWAGGVTGGLLLLPLLGLVHACIFMAAIKVCSTTVVAVSRWRGG